MSHFLTLVLLPADAPDPAGHARQAMLPYWIGDLGMRAELNPAATCDSFTIGGRYDGIIWGKEQHYNLKPDEFQRRYGLDVVQHEDNIRPVAELVPDVVPYAIVTPDGAWHECTPDTADIWEDTARRVLARHWDCIAVAIDCHC